MSASTNPPHLVSAGAGSGKTFRIVQAIVERVRAGTSIDRIAAVTFTEAAAAELQDRVRAGLLAHGLEAEAARVDVAVICTIHRFALTLLQRYPIAAGLPPEPVVLDEDQAATLRRTILTDELYRDDGPAMRAVLERFLGPGVGLSARGWGDGDTPEGRLQQLVRDVLEKGRSIAMDASALAREGDRAAERLLATMGTPGNERLLDAALDEGLALATAYVDKNPEPKRKGDQNFYDAMRSLRSERVVAPFEVALRLAETDPTKTTEKELGSLLAAARASAADHPELRRRLGDGVRGVFALAARVLERYGADKERMGALDFEDMQLLALDLISGRGDGREAYAELVARSLPFVVVDEFQDTSPLQFRLFEALREAGAEVRYVGDLKQGIYGFRTADSALFAALLARAEAHGPAPETLDRSRRSRPELVSFANALFGAVMPPNGLPFAPLTADNEYARGECPKADASIDVLIHPVRPAELKVDAGVCRIVELVASATPVYDRALGRPRPARYGDVAVLAYSHDALAKWAAALRERGVSSVIAARGLFETLEVQLARAWLQMLASPRDRGAAAAVLLSELYGVSQHTMVRMTLAQVSGSPARALALHAGDPAALPLTAFEERALLRCRDDLAAGREALRQLPLPEALERVFERVELADRLAMRLDEAAAAQVRANVAQLVVIAQDLASRGDVGLALAGATGITLENYLLALERAQREDPWQPLAGDDAPDSVRLVTLHASKGMEYPVVVLDVLDRKMEVRLPRVEVTRPDDVAAMLGPDALRASGVQLVPDLGVGHWRDAFRSLFDGELRQRQEWLRLLYVAVTRARDHLVLLWPEESKGGATVHLRSLLTAHVKAPTASSTVEALWLGQRVNVTAVAKPDDEASDDDATAAPLDLTAWRALADDDAPEAPVAPSPQIAPRLARVSPSELCQVADCPEVPRLARFARGERHELARSTGAPVTTARVPDARAARYAVGNKLSAARVGSLVHAAVERARLLPAAHAVDDLALARRALGVFGEEEHRDPMATLMVDTLASLRGALAALGATEEPAREVPFVIDLGGTTLRGVVDLVVRAPDGLHVVDLKTHPLAAPDLARWAAYYRPQLDAYALAVHRLTGEPIAGRHLAVPAAGALVTLPGAFVASHAEASLLELAGTLARGLRGPAQDCAHCGWKDLCRVGRSVLRGAPDDPS